MDVLGQNHDRVQRIPHFVGNCGWNQLRKVFFFVNLLVKNLRTNIFYLQHEMLKAVFLVRGYMDLDVLKRSCLISFGVAVWFKNLFQSKVHDDLLSILCILWATFLQVKFLIRVTFLFCELITFGGVHARKGVNTSKLINSILKLLQLSLLMIWQGNTRVQICLD